MSESPQEMHRPLAELEAGLDGVQQSPREHGTLVAIVRRPDIGKREVVDEGELDGDLGLVGDNWSTRGSSRTEDASAHPEMQVTLINSRLIDLLAGSRERWWLAGDQLFVDLDLSEAHLPPGTRLAVGTATLEVSTVPHTGCGQFADRYGLEAVKFVNSPTGRALRLRGMNAKVVQSGQIRAGDTITRL